MNGAWGRRLAYAVAGTGILLLAYWLRNPLIPYGGATPRASANSAGSARSFESEIRRRAAVAALATTVAEQHRNLARIAARALSAPRDPESAFDYLKSISGGPELGVLVADSTGPVAWAGQFRNTPVITGTGTSLLVSPFYFTLQVAAASGGRTALASALLHAQPPADRIAKGIDDRLPERNLVESFRFTTLFDTTAANVILGGDQRPLFRVEAVPMPEEMIRFGETATTRGRGAIALGIAIVLLIAVGWADRRAVATRLFTIVAALASIALVPWNSFSNFARIFDPAYFYSPVGGPFTSSAGPFAMFSVLLVLAVIALIRGRYARIPRSLAAAGTIAFIAIGLILTERIARGIVLPRSGAIISLWSAWQIPLFLFLFAFFLAAAWFLRIAFGRRPMVELRTAAAIAFLCGAISTFMVWTKTTEQRLQLAMRDVAGLERVDSDAALLLSRFGSQLLAYDTAGNRAQLLERYAVSDLAPAGLQISLGTTDAEGRAVTRLDLAQIAFDQQELDSVAADAIARNEPVIRQTVGPSGRLTMLAAPHRLSGATTVVASPRTRLIAPNAYTVLLGFDQPDKTEPPYNLTLADVTPGGGATAGSMTWHRLGNEWHGDQIVQTSNGPARAHVEIDLRTWPTRLVRAVLIVILDVVIAGMLWALATMSEGSFVRWIRGRSLRWIRSYRGRLTLALFAFFVIPAVGFALWSYQRLQRDDRGVRELLVREILSTAANGDPIIQTSTGTLASSPLFVFSDGVLSSSSDTLYTILAPAGRLLPRRVHVNIALQGELTASSREKVADASLLWGYRAIAATVPGTHVVATPARSDELVLDRRRRDLTLLVLFATAVGAIAALWLSGIAARVLARDLELSRLEVRRAERVIAWGEMARQVAHEIKNPLTPIRLGVQHLKRARSDPRVDFDRVLDENVTRILSEIDRLDKIAQTFTRYGSAPDELPPAEQVDAAAILRDVVALEKMGIGGVEWILEGAASPCIARARKDELRDVLLNVFENARLARARTVEIVLTRGDRAVQIDITDDGSGIATAALPRVFEPHFSTRTTGSGLGLAISRRLLESWGGSIDIVSEEGRGARVSITLQAA